MAQRLGILAPSGRDAAVIEGILASAGVAATKLASMTAALEALEARGIGALVLAEEAVTAPALAALEGWLGAQPPWSDLPVVLLTHRGRAPAIQTGLAQRLGNVTLLERPLHPVSLVAAARAALRARERQHEAERHVGEIAAERAALAESERRYRTLFETIESGFCIVELELPEHGGSARIDYRVVEANPAFHLHTGFERGIVGRWLREAAPLLEEPWFEAYGRVARTGEAQRFEQGSELLGRWFDVHAFPQEAAEPGGRPRVAILFNDITERRRSEAALRDSEEFSRRVLQASSDCIKVLTLDGRLEFMSEGGQVVMEVDDFEAVRGACWPDLWGEEERAKVLDALRTAQAGGTGRFQGFSRTMKGSPRWWDVAVTPILGGEGRVERLLSVSRDVSDTKRAEERLRELNETLERRVAEALAERRLLADLVEGTDSFVQVLGRDFRWLAINRAAKDEFERLFGRRPEVGDSLPGLIGHPPDREAARALWSRALGGERFTVIHEFGDPGRDRRSYELTFALLRDAAGEPVGAYQFGQDVTERLRDQERLAEATARVHEMAKLETLGQLTGGVAHDFNNLLTPIVGALDLLRRRVDGDERSARLIEGAMQGAERATVLVQRLLGFARRQHLETKAVDVGALVEGMGDLIRRSIGPLIPVEVTVAPDLPPARVDPNQLELAVLNLAVNARDAMDGDGRIAIDVGLAQPGAGAELARGDYVRVSVADTGRGMDEATLARAVEPFFTTKEPGKGTGLGLSMIHGLAAQSGGALRLRSRVGEGTVAELWLPVSREEAEAAADTEDGPGPRSRPATILLVDDDDLVRAATEEMLRGLGHRVLAQATPAGALGILGNGAEVDLLVSDHLMPEMRGTRLIAEARALRPGLPALLVTGYAQLGEDEAQGVPRLAKPFREADLARQIARLVPAG